jgi:putative membrane protein
MKSLIGSIAVACAFTCVAVAGQEPAKTPTRPAVPGAKPASPDAPFIGTAAMDGLAEIEHGRLAMQRASSANVRQFAQRMVDDHRKAGDELKRLASQKDVTLATELDDQHRATHDNLVKLQGAAFDEAYMDHMVKAHLQAVALFQQEGKTGADPEVKAWALKTLPMLQAHAKLATSINATVGKAGRGRP